MKKYTLEAAPAAGAKELKNQKAAKAKRIVVGGPTARIFVGGYSSAFGVSSSDCDRVEKLAIDTVSEYGV